MWKNWFWKNNVYKYFSGLIKPKKGKIYCDGLEIRTYENSIWKKKGSSLK